MDNPTNTETETETLVASLNFNGAISVCRDSNQVSNIHPLSIESLLSGTWAEQIKYPPCQTPLAKRLVVNSDNISQSQNRRTKVLFCHDMMGGYVQDGFLPKENSFIFDGINVFSFHFWGLIDIFTYFAHSEHPIIIPPPFWIHLAHLHGVSVWGVFMTEWNNGSKICKNLFSDRHKTLKLAAEMKTVAKFLNFEGWLINIENDIDPDHLETFHEFLKSLSEVFPEKICYYDSLNSLGQLQWQNSINIENIKYHSIAGATFLNYSWNSSDIQSITSTLSNLRLYSESVFLGLDCFGRYENHPGGIHTFCGRNNSFQLLDNFSLAVFAPGWVWEVFDASSGCDTDTNTSCGSKMSKIHQSDLVHFFSAAQKSVQLWSPLNSKISSLLQVETIFSIPFSTCFSLGYGQCFAESGSVLYPHPWHNFLLAEPIPVIHYNSLITIDGSISGDGVDTDAAVLGERERKTPAETIAEMAFSLIKPWTKGNSLLLSKGSHKLFYFQNNIPITEPNSVFKPTYHQIRLIYSNYSNFETPNSKVSRSFDTEEQKTTVDKHPTFKGALLENTQSLCGGEWIQCNYVWEMNNSISFPQDIVLLEICCPNCVNVGKISIK